MNKLVILLCSIGLAASAFAQEDESQKRVRRDVYQTTEWKVDRSYCGADTYPDFLKIGDNVKPWRFAFLRRVSLVNNERKLRLRKISRDRKDVFGIVTLTSEESDHEGGTHAHDHCVALEYVGSETVDGTQQQRLDVFIKYLPSGRICDGEFLDEKFKAANRNGCSEGHAGGWGAAR